MIDLFKSTVLMFVLPNPFLVIVYLVDMLETLEKKQFKKTLIQGAMIASAVFCSFAIVGDFIFSGIVQAEFASFQIFGGVVFF